MNLPTTLSRQRGFTLLEALIALLVMAFGMLAIAGLQTTLSRNSDVAKQRSEAVRLAQAKVEELRAFDGITAASGVAFSYAARVVSSSSSAPETLTAGSNTTFTRTWTTRRADGTTESAPDDLEKWVTVTVAWTDRTGEAQRVVLSSAIARNDPLSLKGMIGGQARERVRYPKGRNINIPYPAVTLRGGNSSAFIPPPGNVVYVFDNDTGNILQSCSAPPPVALTGLTRAGSTVTVMAVGHTFSVGNKVQIAGTSVPGYDGRYVVSAAVAGTSFSFVMSAPLPAATTATGGTASLEVNLVENLDLATSGLSCTTFSVNAYLLSGYVRFKTGQTPTADNIENTTDQTMSLLSSGPLVVDTAGTGSAGAPVAQVCYAQRQKVLSANRLDTEDIASIVRSNGTVTLTTRRSHSFVPGLRIAVEFVPVTPGTPPLNFNNSFTVLTVGSNTLTYADDGPSGSASSGQVSLIQQITVPESTPDPAGYGQLQSRFIAYTCIVTPPDDDNNAATPPAWWGELKLVPSGWTIGNANGNFRVCRFSSDYISDAEVSNHEHPRYYRRVSGALDNQNFLVINSSDDCPRDVDPTPLSNPPDYVNANTASHQGGTGPEYSFKCSSTSCNGSAKVIIEPQDTVTPIGMF